MNKELLQQKAEAYSIGKSWDRKTQSFIDAGYVDQTKKETFLAGAKEILDNPELYLNCDTKKHIKVGEYYAELLNDEYLQEVFTVEFGGSYQLQISRIDGILKVTNGVDGWGKNCRDEFKDAEVKILCDYSSLEKENKELKEELEKLTKTCNDSFDKIQDKADEIRAFLKADIQNKSNY